jgi:hypothetical protein
VLKPVRSMLVALSMLATIAAGCGGGAPAAASADPASVAEVPTGTGPAGAASAPTGSDAGGGDQAGSLSACELLTDADIEELTDRTPVRREPGVAMGVYQDGCEWAFDEEAGLGLVQLVVGTVPTGGRSLWERSFAGIADDAGMEPVRGIGEEAFRQGAGSFSAIQGDRIVDVFYFVAGAGGAGAQDEAAQALLVRALARASGSPVEAGGGAATPDAGASDTDICALLSASQIEEFALVPLEAARPLPDGCRWVLDTDSPVPDAHGFTVEVIRSGGRARFDALSALERVPGIGDGAVRSGGNTDGNAWALTDDTLVKLQYALPIDTIEADPIVLPLLELVVNGLSGA